MPDSDREPGSPAGLPTPPQPDASSGVSGSGQGSTPRSGGWPLPVKILLAAVVLAFVWSPFLAMLMRLSNINPDLAPGGQPSGVPDLAPPLSPPGAPPAGGRRSPAPSP